LLDLFTAVKLATIESRSKEEGKSRVYAVEDETDDSVDVVAYCQQRGQQQQHCFNPSFRGNNRGSTSNSGNRNNSWRNNSQGNNYNSQGNNSNSNKQICVFCNIPNHCQVDCQKRIAANKPCLDTIGCPFWPKINAAADNQNQQLAAPIQSLQDFQF
jgi:hypothetical protein